MKKKTKIVLVSICVLVAIIGIALYAFMSSEFYRKEKAPTAWDCSVTCAEESTPNNYVINYTDSKVISSPFDMSSPLFVTILNISPSPIVLMRCSVDSSKAAALAFRIIPHIFLI